MNKDALNISDSIPKFGTIEFAIKDDDEKNAIEEVKDDSDNAEKQVSMMKLLCNSRFTLAAISSTLCYFTYSFMEPILATRLLDFQLTTTQIGMFFAILPIFYIPSSIAVQFFPVWIEKRLTMILASLFSAFSFLFVGPSLMFHFNDSLLLMAIGQGLVGVFIPYLLIPGLPEMVDSTLPLYPGQEREVNDLSSGVFAAFLGIGQVLSPPYGSYMTAAYGFRTTSDVVAIMCFVFALVYFYLGNGPEAIRLTCENYQKMKKTDQLLGDDRDETVSHASKRSKLSKLSSMML